MEAKRETTTRQGCRVRVERAGPSVGITIVQASGRSDLYACGADEAREIAEMILDVAGRDPAGGE